MPPRPLLDSRRPGLLLACDLVLASVYGLIVWAALSNAFGTSTNPVVLGASALSAVTLGACRRWPLVSYAASLTAQVIATAWMLRHGNAGSGLFVFPWLAPGAYSLARIGARYSVRVATTAGAALLCTPVTALITDGAIGPLFVVPLVIVPALVIGQAVGRQLRYGQQLVRYHSGVAELERDRARLAVAEERMRIARELHDVISHHLSVITVQAGYGSLVIDEKPAKARAALGAIETTGRQVLEEMRALLGVLRADDDDAPRAPAPGLAEAGQLVELTGHAGVRTELTVHGLPRQLPPGIDLAAYRILQESLTNVVKHAGTDTCRVRIAYEPDAVTVDISDDGRGGPGDGPGLGVAGMRERAELYGGRLEAGPLPGRGYRVSAFLPLPAGTLPAEDAR
ncbi:MAG: hypothetical protein QG622_846 [Actinomycetota bacterium]|nr:hypothetical protein [Actinomycetota bacterium]